jgi:hypothetical protein
MTLQTPPSWLQAGSYPAQFDRLTAQALYATTGIIGSSSMAVSANSPVGMSVRVASGWAAVVGTTTTNMGVYTAYNDATVTLTITTADVTNPRIDLVCMTVRDAFYSGANSDVIYQVIAGTPAGSPVAPALPANSISLATVAVAATATQINTVNITDTRVDVTTNLPIVTLTGTQTLTNKTLLSPDERVTVSATAATGTVNFDLVTQAILYYTTDASADFTLNFRGDSGTTLNSILAIGDSISAVFLNTNGATPYYASAFQIDGSAVTPKWSGGIAPTAGSASSIDSYSFTIIKTANATFTVLAGGAVKFA